MAQPVAIVTAAGRGMGAGVARRLAADGWAVALISPSGGAERLAAQLGGLGLTGSVSETADLERLVQGTLDRWGRIDGLVNNTGHPPKGSLLGLSDADWHRGFDLVLLSAVRLCRLVTPVMRQQGKGAIVNLTAFGAVEPDGGFPLSSTLRAGLAAFAKIYADENAAAGIRMNSVLPGFIDSLPETAERRARIPQGRYGTVEEIAATVAFLLSDGAGHITGQSIRVDGGMTRSL